MRQKVWIRRPKDSDYKITRINKEGDPDYHLYMGGGVSRCLLAKAGDWNPPTVVGLSRPCLELPSIELLLVNELLREEA